MSKCKIMRRMLKTKGTMSMRTGKINVQSKVWEEEECGTPIFGAQSHKRKVCDSCLEGWTHEHNFMLDTPENKTLIEKEKKYLAKQKKHG